MVPTTTATMADLRSIGLWRSPQRMHLTVPVAADHAPGGRKTKARPERVVRPQLWQALASGLLVWAGSSDCRKLALRAGGVQAF